MRFDGFSAGFREDYDRIDQLHRAILSINLVQIPKSIA